MRLFLAILVGKTISFLTRTLKKGGGSAAPGLYALKIEPKLVEKLVKEIPKNVVITGTNGKTTTARLLAHLAKEAGLKVIRNSTGSNLERGIASALINSSALHLGGVASNFDLGIWELDEAAFNSVAPKLKPDVVVFLNVFRDQLDRYGETDRVVKKWSETIKKLPDNTTLLVNGDDLNTLKLKDIFKGKVETFGVKGNKIQGESAHSKTSQPKLDFEAKNIKSNGLTGSSFDLSLLTFDLSLSLPIPGIYHIYDAVAALAAGTHLNLPIHRLTDSLKDFSPAFGRFEKISFQHPELQARNNGFIFLIKNPTGATEVFRTIAPQIKKEDRLLIALNDNLADGTDVSWIWDAKFEVLFTSSLRGGTTKQSNLKFNPTKIARLAKQVSLASRSGDKSEQATLPLVARNNARIICTGARAADLAVRLKYAGFEANTLQVTPNLKQALEQARTGLKGQLFILPTYTALLELQSLLTQSGLKSHYWVES